MRRTLTAGIAIAATCAGGVSPAGAGTEQRPERATIAFPAPESGAGPRGVVVARQIGRRPRLKVHISLHDGKANTRYRVVETRRGCSATVGGEARGVWSEFVEFDDEGNAYVTSTARRRGRLSSVRAARVYEARGGGKFVQRACGVVSGTYDSGTGILT